MRENCKGIRAPLSLTSPKIDVEKKNLLLISMSKADYADIFTKAAGGSNNTMDIEAAVALCRSEGWTEEVLPTQTIKDSCGQTVDYTAFENLFKNFSSKQRNVAECRRDFARMDADGSGRVTVMELTKYYREKHKDNPEYAEISAREEMSFTDEDGDKELTLEEFMASYGL